MGNPFKDRLARLHGARDRAAERGRGAGRGRVFHAEGTSEAAPVGFSGVADPLDGVERRWAQMGAVEVENAHGSAVYLERMHKQSSMHGRIRLAEAAACDLAPIFAALELAHEKPAAPFDKAQAIFVDLETTGLQKSDFAFCIGAGQWIGSRFRVRHYLCRRPSEEPAALQSFVHDLDARALLVTYNGRSFDAPALRRRLERFDIAHPLDEMAHLDLLHASRRAWPERRSYSLASVEADRCGLRRRDDVGGAQIPRRWASYLRQGNPVSLRGIIEHNRLDIVSLTALLPALAEAFGGQRAAHPLRPPAARGGPTQAEPTAASTTPKTPLKASLSRSYNLRRRTTSDRQRATASPASAPAAPGRDRPRSRGDLRRALPIGQHVRRLRERVEASRDHDERRALLHELLAVEPRHIFALRELAAIYRADGQDALAQVLERRLADEAPY